MKAKFICKYCGKEFETSQKLGGHVSRCKLNPICKITFAKIGNKIHKNANFKDRKLVCEICGKEYILNLSDTNYNNGTYRKTCSDKCAHVLSIKKSPKDRNDKISNSVKQYNLTHNTFKIRICEYCGKEYTKLDSKSYKYCCNDCMVKGRYKKLSESAKRNKFGGLNPDTTHRNYKRGYYNNIWCDSSWELAFVVYCLEHGIHIERNHEYKEYIFDNKIYKFYPDFIINGTELIEIKGFITPKNKAKIEQINDVTFIYKKDIKKYINYVVEKYGIDYCNILYTT